MNTNVSIGIITMAMMARRALNEAIPDQEVRAQSKRIGEELAPITDTDTFLGAAEAAIKNQEKRWGLSIDYSKP